MGLLPTKPTLPVFSPIGDITLVYAGAGVGKTTFGASIPRSVLIDADNGARQLKTYRVPCTVTAPEGTLYREAEIWQTFLTVTNELRANIVANKGARDFDFVVIDTVTKALASALVYVQKQHNVTSMVDGKFSFGKGYALFFQHLDHIFKMYRTMNIGLIFLAHEKLLEYNDEFAQKRYKWQPDISKAVYEDFKRRCDHIVRLTVKSDLFESGESARTRVLSGEPTSSQEGKTRGGIYVDGTPAEWSAIMDRYKKAQENSLPKTQPISNPKAKETA